MKDAGNIHIPPTQGLQIPGGEHLKETYEMYEVKLVSQQVSQSVNQSVSQSLSQLGQSVNRVGMHLNHVTIMVNEIDL